MSGRESGTRPRRWKGPWAPRSRSAAGLRIAGLLAVLGPATGLLVAQEVSLGQVEDRYRNAVQEYQLAMDVAADQRQVWEDHLTTLEQARIDLEEARSQGSGAEVEAASRARDAAFRAVRTEFRELQRMEARVTELRDRVDDTRRTLLASLESRLQTLETRFAAVTDPVESERVQNQILDVTAQYRRLQDQAIAPDPAVIINSPSITLDPRDGPAQLRFKALFLERRVAEADSAIVQTDRELEDLRTLQRIQQASGDFRAGLDRFGDTRLPTGPPRPASAQEGGIPADSAAAQDARPLEEQIQELMMLRERLVEFREATAKRAEEFRARLRRITE